MFGEFRNAKCMPKHDCNRRVGKHNVNIVARTLLTEHHVMSVQAPSIVLPELFGFEIIRKD